MHLTQVAPTGSMVAQWKIIRGLFKSSRPGSRPKKAVAITSFDCGGQGFRCPRCGGGKAWPVRATLFQCSRCNGQTSVTAGTVFQDTRKPLATWFRAMWFVTSQKNGASALGLQRVLGLGSYRTAWSWLHKLRRAMVRSRRDRLAGWVEVDETYLGAPEAQSRLARAPVWSRHPRQHLCTS